MFLERFACWANFLCCNDLTRYRKRTLQTFINEEITTTNLWSAMVNESVIRMEKIRYKIENDITSIKNNFYFHFIHYFSNQVSFVTLSYRWPMIHVDSICFVFSFCFFSLSCFVLALFSMFSALKSILALVLFFPFCFVIFMVLFFQNDCTAAFFNGLLEMSFLSRCHCKKVIVTVTRFSFKKLFESRIKNCTCSIWCASLR